MSTCLTELNLLLFFCPSLSSPPILWMFMILTCFICEESFAKILSFLAPSHRIPVEERMFKLLLKQRSGFVDMWYPMKFGYRESIITKICLIVFLSSIVCLFVEHQQYACHYAEHKGIYESLPYHPKFIHAGYDRVFH